MPYNNKVSKETTMTATKTYRIRVETYDGCTTIWYETSRAKRATDLIVNRVYNQLCGLNIKEVEATLSVPVCFMS
jgi:hypothetical protein